MSGFNYSKWDNIELSDDESDLHPNIDKESWFRMKHRSRLEREEREDEEIKHIEKINTEDAARLKIIAARIKVIETKSFGEDNDAEFDDIEALKVEFAELKGNTALRLKRVDEIKERRKWNIDNICVTSEERTIVSNKQVASLKADDFVPTGATAAAMAENEQQKKQKEARTAAAAAQGAAVKAASTSASATAAPVAASTAVAKKIAAGPTEKNEKTAVLSYNDYVLQHEDLLEAYSEMEDMQKTKEFVFKNCDILLHEHSQSYMLLSCLEDEMNGKHKRMRLVCRQSQILSHIQELGGSMARDPRDVVLPFFSRIEEKEYFAAFLEQVKLFEKRIQERAVVKRKEMDMDKRLENAPLGPGGLDPFEVLESLPPEMRDAFESQEISRLQDVLAAMPVDDAKKYMKMCIDSGLWCPGGGDGEEEQGEGSEEQQKLALELDPLD